MHDLSNVVSIALVSNIKHNGIKIEKLYTQGHTIDYNDFIEIFTP